MKHIKLYEETLEPDLATRRYPNGNLKSERWHLRGRLHREDGPAVIEYYPDGRTPKNKMWYLEDRLHRRNGPAWIGYDPEGRVSSEHWYDNGTLHHEGAPAVITYYEGKLAGEFWFRNGQEHREDGPAVVHYSLLGEPVREEWYRHGDQLSAKEAQRLKDEISLKQSGVSDEDIQVLKDAGII